MPTYQYRCRACANELEAFQKFTDDPLTDCPECGGALRKLFSPVGIVFKGSGFYATDSRKGAKTATASTSTSAKSESAKSESSSSESATKSDAAPSSTAKKESTAA